MSDILSKIGDGLSNALLMAYEVWWALVLGFAISAIVQAWVPREHAQEADTGHQHHRAGARLSLRERLTSAEAWSDVAHNFRNDWGMLWKEITVGFFLAGFIGLLGNDFFNGLFVKDAPAGLR